MMKFLSILSVLSLLACSHARQVNFGPQLRGMRAHKVIIVANIANNWVATYRTSIEIRPHPSAQKPLD